MPRQIWDIAAAAIGALVLLYVFGVFGGGEVAAPTTPPAIGTPGTTQ